MSENLSKAACTEQEYEMARAAGLLVVTTDDERAIHKFAEAVRQEWISVTDRMPPDDTGVLLCMPDGDRLVGYRSFYDSGYFGAEPSGYYWYCGKDDPLDWDEPTHWMKLPFAAATPPQGTAS